MILDEVEIKEESGTLGADFESSAVVISSVVYAVKCDSEEWRKTIAEPILAQSTSGYDAFNKFVEAGIQPKLTDYRISRVLRNVKLRDNVRDVDLTKSYNEKSAKEYNNLIPDILRSAQKFGISTVINPSDYSLNIKLRIIQCAIAEQIDQEIDWVLREFE